MEELGQKFGDALTSYGPNVVAALAILVIGYFLAKLATGLLRRALERGSVDSTLIGFASNIFYMGVMALVVISALGRLGVATTSFAAILGASALAVGFALQGSLANFAAGVMLILFRPFKVGDFVEAGGEAGVVEEIQVFATKMRTGDNKEITVPNGAITGGSITNYSAKDTRRIDLVIGIGYDDDIALAKSILEEVVGGDSRVLKEPAPVVAVAELADSSVNFVVRPWVKSADYWATLWDLTERIKITFDQRGISIPYPQTDVHVHQSSAAA